MIVETSLGRDFVASKTGKYGSYERIHQSAHPSDLETAKIRRKTARSIRRRLVADQVSRDVKELRKDKDFV